MSHLGYERVVAIDRFEDAWRRVQMKRILGKLTNRRRRLLPFATIHGGLFYPSGVYQGIQENPVRRIQGSLTQNPEFDRDFRPLYKNQRNRWVNVWVLHAQKGWEPIVVHQIDGLYFVEDGHHRISVARDLGLDTIEARVTAYPGSIVLNPNASLDDIMVSLEAAFPALTG
jgi:hypothetical protein